MWIITSLSLTLCFTGGYLSKKAPSSTSILSKRTSWEVSTTNITARKESAAISWNCHLLTPSGFQKACDLYRVGAKLAREYLIQFNGENLFTRSVGRTTLLVTRQQIENISLLLDENVLSFSLGWFALSSFVVWVGNSPFGPEVYGKLDFSRILPFGILMFLWVACGERESERACKEFYNLGWNTVCILGFGADRTLWNVRLVVECKFSRSFHVQLLLFYPENKNVHTWFLLYYPENKMCVCVYIIFQGLCTSMWYIATVF